MKLVKILVAALALLTVVVAPVFATSAKPVEYFNYNGVKVPYDLAVRLGMVANTKAQTEAEKCAAKNEAHKLFMAPYELAVKTAEEKVATHKANFDFAAKLRSILTVFNTKADRDKALAQLVTELKADVVEGLDAGKYLPSDIEWVKKVNTQKAAADKQHALLEAVVSKFLEAEKAGLPVLDLKGYAEALKASSESNAKLVELKETLVKHAKLRRDQVAAAMAEVEEKLTKEKVEELVKPLETEYKTALAELQAAKDLRDLMALNYPGCTVPGKTQQVDNTGKKLPATGVR